MHVTLWMIGLFALWIARLAKEDARLTRDFDFSEFEEEDSSVG